MRVLVCAVVICLLFGLVTMRLWQVQVLQGSEHQKRVQRQMIRPVRINPVRGRIFDRNGKVLVDNDCRYDLVFYVSEMRRRGKLRRTVEHILETDRSVAAYLGREPTLTYKQVENQLVRKPILPLTVAENLTATELAAWSEYLPHVQGADILPRVERRYPYPGMMSQALGLTSRQQPSGDDILEDLPRLYVTPELTGRSGLEAAFDSELAGKAAAQLVMVDSVGYARKVIRNAGTPEPGHNLTLTIDLEAQRLADQVLQGHYGALVLLDVHTGAVLAMASAPTYPLDADSKELLEVSNDNVRRPMLNRATRGVYTPGSIVKPLMALAGLEHQPEVSHQIYDCTGRYMLGNHPIRCARRWGHGPLDLIHAITVSCNPFLINLGLKVGIDEYGNMLKAAGLGETSGIEIGDARGLCPQREVARRLWKRNWLAVDTAYASIGQGAISITPLQAAVFTAAIANGGVVYKPHLVRRIQDSNGVLLREVAPVIRNRLPASAENIALVREAMVSVVSGQEASAAELRRLGISLAAKTGTAEVGEGANRHKNTWTVAFGPAENPKFALACVIERGESGSRTAVPIVASFLEQLLKYTPELITP